MKGPGFWFALTAEERKLVLGIAALALIGLAARYVHLKGQQPDPLPAEMLNQIRNAEGK